MAFFKFKLHDYKDYDGNEICIGGSGLDADFVNGMLQSAGGANCEFDISSLGGSLTAGINMYDAIKSYGNADTRIGALACSAASILAMAGKQVKMSKYGLLMIHKPMTSTGGNADDLIKDAAMLNVRQSRIAQIYMDKTGLDAETINSMINAETWLTAEQALSLGFVDVIEDYTAEITNHAIIKPYVQANAGLVCNQVFNKLQIKTPVTKTEMDTNTELIDKTNKTLDKVMNFFKRVFNSAKDGDKVLNFTGVLAVGSAVFNEAGENLEDGTYNIEKDGVKTKLTVANSVVNAMETEAGEEEDTEDVENNAVLNTAGISGVTNKADVKNIADVINKFNGDIRERDAIIAEQQAALTEVRNQVARDEQAIRKDIRSTFQPVNGSRTNKMTDSEAKDENGVKNVLNKSIAPTSPIAKAALERMGIKIKTDEQ